MLLFVCGDCGAALLGLLARGGPEARACFFLLAETLLRLPPAASGASAAAATAAPLPVGNEDTKQAMLLSPAVCCILRSSRKALSLSDSNSTISRLLHIAGAAWEAVVAAKQHTPEAAVFAAADTGPDAPPETPAAHKETPASAAAAAKCLLLELTCAFKALAAFMRQQPEAAAATYDADTVPDFVTLVIEASFIVCCCRCSRSNSKEDTLESMIMREEGLSATQQRQHHQQQVCCSCFYRRSVAPVAVAHAGLEAAALEALSLLPHIQIHCRNQQHQELVLQLALAAVTIPAEAASQFPAAAVACCMSPSAIAPAAALHAALLEQLQQQQLLVHQLLLQQQQQETADPALFVGCGTGVDNMRGPTLWEAQWRCAADVTTAAFNALRLPALVAAAASAQAAHGSAETGWRADYPPHVLRVLQGALLLRRLLLGCSLCSAAAEAALQKTAWTACCSWRRQLPSTASSDASVSRLTRRSSKIGEGKAGAACATAGVHNKPSGGLKASRPQQLLQRLGFLRLKKKSFCAARAASFAEDACFAAEHGPSDFSSESIEGSALQMSIVAAVLSGVFRTRPDLLCSPAQKQQQQQVSSSVVDTLWCCCEKALATAPPLERLLYADVAGGLYSLLRIADSPTQQQPQDTAAIQGMQGINKHLEAFLQMPVGAPLTGRQEAPLLMSPSRLCGVSLLAARLLPLLQHSDVSATAAADGSSKCCLDLLKLALVATSSIEAAEEAAAAVDPVAPAATNQNPFEANVSSSCALLCVIRFLGVALPAVASDAAAAACLTTDPTASAAASAECQADSTCPQGQQRLQRQQRSVLQQQLFRALHFAFLLRSSQSDLSRAAVLAADAARHLLECLLQQATTAAAAGPFALLSATEDFIAHAVSAVQQLDIQGGVGSQRDIRGARFL